MCLAIYPLSDKESIDLPFAMERIYQRRDGSATIWLDLLIRNTSESAPITRLRLLLPYALVDLPYWMSTPWSQVEAVIPKWRSQQQGAIKDETPGLAAPDDNSNWVYRVVGHTKIDRTKPVIGTFAISKEGGPRQFTRLEGFIKHEWHMEQPLDDRTWLLYALNNLAVFDVACRGQQIEHLRPKESMWLRLTLQIPADRYNRKPILYRIFGRTYEYRQLFKSPARIVQEAFAILDEFSANGSGEWSPQLSMAQARARQHLPQKLDSVVVRDWRTFMYREYGLGIRKIEQRARKPCGPSADPIFTLPPAADPKGCRRFPMPKFLHFVNQSKTREVEATEFFFGSDWPGCDHPDDYVIDSYTEAGNAVYNYLAWAGLIGLTLGLINFAMNLLR